MRTTFSNLFGLVSHYAFAFGAEGQFESDDGNGFGNHVSQADFVKDIRILLGTVGNDQVGSKNAVPNFVDKGLRRKNLIGSDNRDVELLTKSFDVVLVNAFKLCFERHQNALAGTSRNLFMLHRTCERLSA
jgi:hypothetical protein